MCVFVGALWVCCSASVVAKICGRSLEEGKQKSVFVFECVQSVVRPLVIVAPCVCVSF